MFARTRGVHDRGVVRRASFEDCVAIVTGGGSGIGRALAAELASKGAFVTIADICEDVDVVAKELDTDGSGRVRGARVDVRDFAALRDLVAQVVQERGRLDLMVNNAGIAEGGFSHELDIGHWRRTLDVNLLGVVNGVVAVYPTMVEQGSGTIVNTASLAGLAPAIFVAAYTASKHAVVGLSLALRPEAARRGVVVTALCPGAVDTPILDAPPAIELDSDAWTMPGREYMRRARFPLQPAERFARRAARGIARGRAVVLGSPRSRAMWLLHRASPTLTDRASRLVARRLVGAIPLQAEEAAATG